MEKNENDIEDKVVRPSQKHYEDFAPSAAPVAPDGGIAPGFGIEPPAPSPEVTPENFVCLRGPCRHYWHLVTMSGDGNPKGTWEALGIKAPRQHHHTCTVNQGMETDLTEDCVFVCSRWEPMSNTELVQLKSRRDAYFKSHPEIKKIVENEH